MAAARPPPGACFTARKSALSLRINLGGMGMDGPLSNAQTSDVEALLHPYTNAVEHRKSGPLIIETGKGVYVYDDAGKRYIEGMAGLWCAGLGFGDAELIEAAKEQL